MENNTGRRRLNFATAPGGTSRDPECMATGTQSADLSTANVDDTRQQPKRRTCRDKIDVDRGTSFYKFGVRLSF